MLNIKEWSRGRWEFLTVVLVLIMASTVLLVSVKSQGTLTYYGGKITYTGQIVNHRMNGYGQLTFDNGDVYEGDFQNGVFSGQGKFVAKTGWSYEGEFKNGQPDGEGKLIAKDKKIYEGTFKQGIYQK